MPEIEFVNHASVIISYDKIRLITDPWLEGNVFYNGWQLIEPTKFMYSDFEHITHIWFSHEHPDHFSPPSLKKIPIHIRKNIVILFQKTKDKKVIEYCKELNFKECVELDEDWCWLGVDFKLLNIPHSDGDSWLCIKINGYTFLNLNDCVLEDKKQMLNIKERIDTNSIDILFTQFSYANWVGNIYDTEGQKKQAAKKILELEKQLLCFNPKYVFPFASFVWFCHEENFYMNENINTINFVFDHINKNCKAKPIVMFPGEKWFITQPHDAIESLNKWGKSYASNINSKKVLKANIFSENELIEAGNEFVENLKVNNTFWMRCFMKPSSIFVIDINCSYELSLNSFRKSLVEKDYCDISLSSDSLMYCFKFLWGGSTTRINGRYQVPENGNFYNWKLYFQISELNNHGNKFDLQFLMNILYKKIKKLVR
ncbi:MAG: MBL fold metallo-hydrolase [Bacteroidia bacterium]|nr:MBL fold metallo-hydrolase [Bacteroidia bacterium]